MQIRRALILLLTTLAFAASASAQKDDGSSTNPDAKQSDADLVKQKLEAIARDEAEAKAAGADGETKRPEAAKPDKLPGLERYVSLVGAVRPQRIGPGGTGTMHLILAMIDSAVLQSGARLEVTYPGAAGPITLGAWTIDSAQPGTLNTRFRGQPVYDNTAVVRIPVQIGSGAQYGTYPIGVSVTAEVTDGETGEVRGTFYGSARVPVVIGDPIPTPSVATPSTGGDQVPASIGGGAPSWQPEDTTGTVRSQIGTPAPAASPSGRLADPESEATPQADPESAVPTPPIGVEKGDLPWLWIAGGVLLFGLVALGIAAARKS